jgi:hypothetical protein
MEKRGKNNSAENLKEEIPFLSQMINSLEQSERKLEEYYKKEDSINFNKTKKLMLQIHRKIEEILDGR